MRKYLLILTLLSLSFLFCQSIDFNLLKPDTLYVGTEFEYKINIKSSVNDSIFTPKPDTLGVFIVKNVSDETKIEKNEKITKISYKLAGFDVGKQTIDPIEFLVKNGSNKTKLKTAEVNMDIKNFVSKKVLDKIEKSGLSDSIKVADIAKLKSVKLSTLQIIAPILFLALLIFIIIFVIKKLNKPKVKVKPKKVIIDTRKPYEKALELLAKLEQEKYLSKGDFLNYYFKLSYILRYFIELEYKFLAVEMTTSEIRKNLKIEASQKAKILNFLNNCDMIKFAKAQTKLDVCENDYKWLYDFINSYSSKGDENV